MTDKHEISLKELFERLIVLETKFDENRNDNRLTARRFRAYTFIIFGIQSVGIALKLIILYVLQQ